MEKIVLFDGSSLDAFTYLDGSPAGWELEDGVMTVYGGEIVSKEVFGDAHIHLEWREPLIISDDLQARGNSGVYIQGCYELQVLDSYGEDIRNDACGSIYKMYSPLVNACKKPLEWQTYDIYFRTARFNERGEMIEAARATILQNGIMIQNNVILHRCTPGFHSHTVAEGPLLLQDHCGDRVSYRNIYIEKY